ncbi:protein of unknown function [Candidatus Filomicrobium marinum]|nr:protein of unknown function [Candidatus Filomicrobium marinum]
MGYDRNSSLGHTTEGLLDFVQDWEKWAFSVRVTGDDCERLAFVPGIVTGHSFISRICVVRPCLGWF